MWAILAADQPGIDRAARSDGRQRRAGALRSMVMPTG
jgi:hypothetical protein